MDTHARWRRRHARAGRSATAGLGVVLALLALLAGCAHAPPASPPAPAPVPAPPRPHPGYDARRDSLDAVDTSTLAGRRIVLDPGHGGRFAGALGVGGLTEAAVNLEVALALRDLLSSHGAVVMLTRETDRDFTTPADTTLRLDLAERSRLAHAFAPELFVSIHHNADARGAHDVNEIQTYYRLEDDGASLDAARSVHRYLARNLSITPHRILPGNYYVLRTSAAPAILTECSYLTNPDVEARLALPEKRRLEAEALFLGVASYLARRTPAAVSLERVDRGPRGVTDGPFPEVRARLRGAADGLSLTVDGVEVTPEVTGDSLRWRATEPLARGDHVITLRARLAGEGVAPARTDTLRVRTPLATLRARFPDQVHWDGRQPLAVRIALADAAGLPFADSLALRVSTEALGRLAPADTVIIAYDGVGWLHLRRTARRRGTAPVEVRVSAAPAQARGRIITGTARLPVRADRRAGVRTGFVLLHPGGVPLTRAPGTREPSPGVRWLDRDGFARLACDDTGAVAVPALRGYRAVASDTPWPPRFAPLFGGALMDRRIALDAEGGGNADGGTGGSGARASDLGLDVAHALTGFLEAAGARVLLVRDGDRAMEDAERLRRAEAFRPERYLRIAHRDAPPVIGHWFGSAAGHAWGVRTAEAFAAMGLPVPPVAEEPQVVLQQSPCPALDVAPARVDVGAEEERLLGPGVLRAEAYALCLALARDFAPEAVWPMDSLEVRDTAGAPVPGAAVRLGGVLVLVTDASGRARFARSEPGPLEAIVEERRVGARVVLLDSQQGVVLAGPPAR